MKTKKQNHIMICICNNYHSLLDEFAFSLWTMQSEFYKWKAKKERNDKLSILMQGGYNLDIMRCQVVDKALREGATHILMLDSDMSFPSKTIVWMMKTLEANKKYGIEAVSGLNTTKSPPYIPLVYSYYNKETGRYHKCSKFPLNEPFEIKATGCACLMVKAEVFRRIRQPYFKFQQPEMISDRILKGIAKELPYQAEEIYPDMNSQEGMGEDFYFFRKAQPLTLCHPKIKSKHYKMHGSGFDEFIRHNNLKLTKNSFEATDIQLTKILQEFEDQSEEI